MRLLSLALWEGLLLASVVSAFQTQSPVVGRRNPTELAVSQQAPSVFVNIDESIPRDIATLDDWATANGVQKNGYQLTSDDGWVDASVMTNQDLPAGSTALFVPSSFVFSGRQAQQELGPIQDAERIFSYQNKRVYSDALGKPETTDHRPQFYLFLKLLLELEKGDQSAWFPWLNSLPRRFSNGAAMTHFCCSEALPPLVGKLALNERNRFQAFYQALKHVKFLSEYTQNNRPLAKWVFSVVYTRSFPSPDGDLKIAPMADMFNHGTQTEIQLNYDEEGNCYAYTTYDVSAGSPLRMSYGDPTNPSHLFARYGFLDETSPATFCKIMIPKPSQELLDLGYDHSRMLFYKDTGEVSPEIWDVLLYQLLESNKADQQAFYQAHVNGDQATKQAFHDGYRAHTVAALRNHVDSFIHSLDRYSAKAAGKDLHTHPRLPLILRHNEFVRNTFLMVQARLQ